MVFKIALTPIHFLAVMPLYFRFKGRIDPLTLLISSTFVDLEPLYLLLSGEPNDHGILHSYFTVLLFSVLIVFAMYFAERHYENRLRQVYGKLRLSPERVKYPLLSIYLTFLIGGFSHMFFDMFTHKSLPYVFYPIAIGNPFYVGTASFVVDVIVAAVAFGSVVWWLKLQNRTKTQNTKNTNNTTRLEQ